MPETLALSPLLRWETFYVIVGSSAAALTGLQFVVVALVAETRPRGTGGEVFAAYSTPTVVHFSLVLWISAVLSAPWNALSSAAVVLALTGAAGVAYAGLVVMRARRQTDYRPVFEDWLWHTAFPLAAYTLVLGGALALVRHTTGALFAIAAAALLLLFTGIHNAWDTVTYIVVTRLQSPAHDDPAQEAPPPEPPPG